MRRPARTLAGQTEGKGFKTFAQGHSIVAMSTYESEAAKNAIQNVHGGFTNLASAQALNSGASPSVTAGIGKLVIVVDSGSDFNGTIRLTGDTVDRETGAVTSGDTDDIAIDSLTTDSSTTSVHLNTIHGYTDAYISSKWFTGSVTISTSDVDVTIDVWQCSFEQVNDSPQFVLDTFDISFLAGAGSPDLDAHLYSVDVTGSKVNITAEATLEVDGGTASKPYRLRKGDIGKVLSGSSDGFFVELFGNNSPSYIENVSMKVWAKVMGSGRDLTTIVATGGGGSGDITGPATSTNQALARWDGTDGDALLDSDSTLTNLGKLTLDDGAGEQWIFEPSATNALIGTGGTISATIFAVTPTSITMNSPIGTLGTVFIDIKAIDTHANGSTIKLRNGSTGKPTAVEIGNDAAGGTGTVKVDNVTSLRTDGDLTLSANGTGKVILASTDKLYFRDSAIFIHSNADGEMTIEADTEVNITNLANSSVPIQSRTRRIYFRIGFPAANDFVVPFVAGYEGDAGTTGYATIKKVMAMTVGGGSSATFNVHVRSDNAPNGAGAVDLDLFSSARTANTTRAEWENGDTAWTAANEVVDSGADDAASEVVVFEVVSVSGSPNEIRGWVEVEIA